MIAMSDRQGTRNQMLRRDVEVRAAEPRGPVGPLPKPRPTFNAQREVLNLERNEKGHEIPTNTHPTAVEGYVEGYRIFLAAQQSASGMDYQPTETEKAREPEPPKETFQQHWDRYSLISRSKGIGKRFYG